MKKIFKLWAVGLTLISSAISMESSSLEAHERTSNSTKTLFQQTDKIFNSDWFWKAQYLVSLPVTFRKHSKISV